MNKEEAMLALIEIKLSAFCDEYLIMDAEESFAALFDACIESEALNLTRGNPDVWAAAIAYAFCRMNFLLDGGSPAGLSVSREEFFAFFEGCNRSSVGQKATKIERALDFHHGHPYFCLPDVVNALPRFAALPNGLIGLADQEGRSLEIGFLGEEESRELEVLLRQHEQALQEEKDQKAEEQRRKRLEALEKKREEERKIQPEFDF